MATTNSTLHDVSSGRRLVKSRLESESVSVSSDKMFRLYIPGYHIQPLKDKGAVLVMLLAFPAFFTFHFFSPLSFHKEPMTTLSFSGKFINPFVIFIISLLLYPFHGWLADTHYGRYNVTKWSLRALLLMSMLFCMTSGLLQYFSSSSSDSYSWLLHSFSILWYAVYIPVSICMGGCLVNSFQLGIDQLADATSEEIVSFFHWILWVWYFCKFLVRLSQSCICLEYKPVGYLLVPLLLTIAVVLDLLFNHWLIKEPVAENSVTLVFKVLRYAMKNKYPRHQSALTRLDDRCHSRLDHAKFTFGGPFTTEQVEDVKSFFRIVVVLTACAFFCGLYLAQFPQFHEVLYHLHNGQFIYDSSLDQCGHVHLENCLRQVAVLFSGPLLLITGIPVFEFVLYPRFKRYLQVSILWRLRVSLIFLLSSIIACIIIELIAHLKTPESALACPFKTNMLSDLTLDYKWVIFPYMLGTIGEFLILTSLSEFLCAQSPYSMKGLLFGLSFGFLGLFSIVGYILLKPIQILSQNIVLSHHYGCLFWYFLIVLGILVVILSVYLLLSKCYKKRSRHEVQ